MSRRLHTYPGDTPVNGRSPEPLFARPNDCIWPDCRKDRLYWIPMCFEHVDHVYMTARDRFENEPDLTLAQRNARAARYAREEREINEEIRIEDTRGNQPGWIYYLRVGDLVKIGYTTNILRRMREYPPDSRLLAVHPGTLDFEKQMHDIFRGSRARGREWYRPEPHLLEHCEKIVAEYGNPEKFEYCARDATRMVA